MHPAKSVIYFTTMTGAGYGLFFWLAILGFGGLLPAESKLAGFIIMGVCFFLIISGLLASTGHLGHPERAWRAMSQWRSSWLSREGLMAILTFIPMSIFAISWVFFGQINNLVANIGLAGAVMAMITVFTTSMIYASLKTIPAWSNIWTKLGYIIMSLMSGAVVCLLLLAIFASLPAFNAIIFPGLILLVLGLMIKILYWSHIDNSVSVSTIETATGLGRFGSVSAVGLPHSEDNYLLKEMGYRIARKHAKKLRIIAAVFGFILPQFIILASMLYLQDNLRIFAMGLSAVICLIGLAFERWLFFAEAKHAVTLYYGQKQV